MRGESEGEKPLVSICCTTYNLEKYVNKAIDSFLSQKGDFDFEIIIHDDASTDRTREIIETYVDQYPEMINPIFQKQNIYKSHPGKLGHILSNYILPKTSGKYIAICDGDDYWTDPYKLSKQIKCLEDNPELSGCTTNALVVNELSNEKRDFHHANSQGVMSDQHVIQSGGASFPTSTLFFEKEKFIGSELYKHYDNLSEYYDYDTLMIYCLLLSGEIGYIEEKTAIYRRWEGGIYSGIMHDADKTARIKEGEINGNKQLLRLVEGDLRKIIKRKISIDSLYVVKNKSGLKKYKYLKEMNIKEGAKLLLGR